MTEGKAPQTRGALIEDAGCSMTKYEIRYVELWPVIRLTLVGGFLIGAIVACVLAILFVSVATGLREFMGDPLFSPYPVGELFHSGVGLGLFILSCSVGLAIIITVKVSFLLLMYNMIAAITGGVRLRLNASQAPPAPAP